MNINEIKNSIKEGMEKGYNENISLRSSYDNLIKEIREYLLTVNVAQKLLKWKEKNQKHYYKINLEYNLKDFYNNAFSESKPIETASIFDFGWISREKHSPTNNNNKKIDIVITKDSTSYLGFEGVNSIIGIEIKGINKNKKDIIADAERLINAMINKDSVGENKIQYCFCSFLDMLNTENTIQDSSLISKYKNKLRDNWDKELNSLRDNYKDLNFSFEIFDIIENPYKEDKFSHCDDYNVVAKQTGSLIGGLITIKRYQH
ncbi:MAG: hypothetical protein ACEPOV_06050 [Hyphomicrobiales bacterium]